MIERLESRLTVALRDLRPDTIVQRIGEPTVGETVKQTIENGANVWPDEASEKSFLAEQNAVQGVPLAPITPMVTLALQREESNAPLPALDDLVNRISPETRQLIDELFRAKFIGVRRAPKTALKD